MPRFKVHYSDDPPPSGSASGSSIRAAGIVVCRLDSTRLPGKVLKSVRGKPLLKWVIDRVAAVQRFSQGVIVATSDRSLDDPIEDFCRQQRIQIFRGAAADLAGRVLSCAREFELDWFARVNADSPFVDPQLLDQSLRIAETGRFDLITNLSPRSFPYGVSVELLRTSFFEDSYRLMHSTEQREHVTQLLYQPGCPLEYRKYNLLNPAGNQSRLHLTVDTPEDWESFRTIAESFEGDVSFREAISLARPIRKVA